MFQIISLYTVFYFENFYMFPQFSLKRATDGSGDIIADWHAFWTDGPIGAFSARSIGESLSSRVTGSHYVGMQVNML